MAPSKSWMSLNQGGRLSDEYQAGVDKFIKYALRRTGETDEVKCPCVRCCNSSFHNVRVVRDHLTIYGIMQSYTFWYHHGERLDETQSNTDSEGEDERDNEDDSRLANEIESDDELLELLTDCFRSTIQEDETDVNFSEHCEEPNDNANKFYTLLRDLEQPLYEGSKCSKLSAVMKLLHIKTLEGWSNKSFSMLLEFLKNELLPSCSLLPDSYYEAKKMIRDLGLSYKKIDACVNNCMLFQKEDEGLDNCKVCDAFRWKLDKRSGEPMKKSNGKRVPLKVLRYFPLKPRLQRLFMSSKIASDMTWHNDKRVKDGVMRHPADSKAWKHFDELYESFASEPRNVRLGLVSDGFQPFANMSTPYSIWPVMLVPYNLPPWLCMKQENSILSMIIPGPDSPGDAIDVYLQPLVEELLELWELGIETYDASRKQNFILHAALMWTINDFLAYGMLSGWSTKGKLACPSCHKGTHSIRLQNCCKQAYMGHRRFLPTDHPWRRKKDVFGMTENRAPPQPLSGDDVLFQVQDLENIPLTRAPHKKVKISHELRGDNWNKKSIFFKLPYWRLLLLRHNLDVMHIEKNVCDIVLGTIMNMKGKTKDTIKSRLDLQAMQIRPELHPVQKGSKIELPPASYSLSQKHKEVFCKFLKELRVPDGFSSNISHCVNTKECKISGLKSHDCHIILQRLLPIAIRGLLPKDICEPLIELSMFFNVLCAKSLRVEDLEQIKKQIPLTLSKLEWCLPPSCFNVMLHLPIHLADEALIGGPNQFRWMYFGERLLHKFKSSIRNRGQPEGSIAENYLIEECMTLCSRYLHRIETKFNRLERNDDGDVGVKKKLSVFSHIGRPLGLGKVCNLDSNDRDRAHLYVLKNCKEISSFFREHSEMLAQSRLQLTNEEVDEHFVEWFKEKRSMASTNKFEKRIFLAPRTLCKNRAQSLRERGLHHSPSRKQHFPDVTSSLKELQHVEASPEVPGEGGETTNVVLLNQSGAELETETVVAQPEVEQGSPGESEQVNNKKRKPNFKPRGPNKCKRLANLKHGEKLELTYFHNGPVGPIHKDMTRHLGILVRDRTICPIRVRSWDEINENAKDHMWAAVLDKFKGNGFELDREDTLKHMRALWHAWRGYLVQAYIKPAGSKEKAYEKIPKNMTPDDWKWLLDEHFFSPEFLKVRQRNSENKSNLTMLHRTGSTPFRQVIYEKLGGKEGKMPIVAEIFKETRKKKSGTLDAESATKLEEIMTKSKENPHFSAFELIEECFGPQDRDHVACFGRGMKPKDVRGPLPSRAQLQAMLRDKEKENIALHKRMDDLEESHKSDMNKLEDQMQKVIDLLMTQQQHANVSGSTFGTDEGQPE